MPDLPQQALDVTVKWSAPATDGEPTSAGEIKDPRVGRPFGRFQSLELLGRGAFGAVYRAYDPDLDRPVALKIPRAGALEDEEAVHRFLREARAAAQLRHPHIVAVHEVGQVEGVLYIASDLIAGKTLRQAIQQQRVWPPQQAAALVIVLADALEYSHRQGIVHRDIKPENILLGDDGQAYVLDFGLARRSNDSLLATQDGTTMGTPAYMSPEQARGQSHLADARSDLWSLGVLLYELLTGQWPFRGGNSVEMLTGICQREPAAPRKLNPAIPRDLETICLKCLEKDPARRYASCQELQLELQRWQRHEPILARPVGPWGRALRWCRRKPALATAATCALVAVLCAAGVGVNHLAYRSEATAQIGQISESLDAQQRVASSARVEADTQRQRADEEYRKTQRQISESLLARGLSDCGDGQLDRGLLAFAAALPPATNAGDQRLDHVLRANIAAWLPRTSQLEFILPQTNQGKPAAPLFYAVYSSDGRYIVSGGRQLFFWDTRNERIEDSYRTEFIRDLMFGMAWGPDAHVISGGGKGAHSWNGRNGSLAKTMRAPHSGDGVLGMAIGPDGATALTWDAVGKAQLWDTISGRRLAEIVHGEQLRGAAFSPNGRLVATCGQPGVRLWDSLTGAATGPTFECPLTQTAQFTSDSKRIIAHSGDVRLYDVATGKPIGASIVCLPPTYTSEIRDELPAALHANNRTIAVRETASAARYFDLFTGKPLGPPMEHSGTIVRMRFTRDGRFLLCGALDGTARLWNLTGTLVGQPLRHREGVTAIGIRQDSQQFFTADIGGELRVWKPPAEPDVRSWKSPGNCLNGGHILYGDRVIMFTGAEDQLFVQDSNYKTGEVLHRYPLETSKLSYRRLALSDNGVRLAVAAGRDELCIWQWNLETGQSGPTIRIPESNYLYSIAYSPNAEILSVHVARSPSRHYLAASGEPIELSLPPDCDIQQYSPAGDAVLCLGPQAEYRLFRLVEGKPTGEPVILGPVRNPTFNLRGTGLAMVDRRYMASAIDAKTGQLLGPPMQLNTDRSVLALSSDKTWLAAVDVADGLTFWDVATGQPVGPRQLSPLVKFKSGPPKHATPWTMRFSDDDRWLTVYYSDDVVRQWHVPQPATHSPEALRQEIEARLGVAADESGTLTVLDRTAWLSLRPASATALAPVSFEPQGKPRHEDSFLNPRSGFRVLANTSAKSSSSYKDGRFVIQSEQKNLAVRSSPWTVKNFACRICARTLGGPDDYWSLILSSSSDPTKQWNLHVHLHATGTFKVQIRDEDRTTELGPFTHPTIRPGPLFNEVLVVVRGKQLSLKANGEAVGEPIQLPTEIPPARLYLGGGTTNGGQSEFESIRIWDLPPSNE